METLSKASTILRWDPDTRIAYMDFAAGAHAVEEDGVFLADSLARWIGTIKPFGVLVDARELVATDGAFRARANKFFSRHRDRASIALCNVRPIIHIAAEMFRIGAGVALKTFSTEDTAREWLRQRGIAA